MSTVTLHLAQSGRPDQCCWPGQILDANGAPKASIKLQQLQIGRECTRDPDWQLVRCTISTNESAGDKSVSPHREGHHTLQGDVVQAATPKMSVPPLGTSNAASEKPTSGPVGTCAEQQHKLGQHSIHDAHPAQVTPAGQMLDHLWCLYACFASTLVRPPNFKRR